MSFYKLILFTIHFKVLSFSIKFKPFIFFLHHSDHSNHFIKVSFSCSSQNLQEQIHQVLSKMYNTLCLHLLRKTHG